MPSDKKKILSLEFGRFIAALLVACFHYTVAFQHLRNTEIFGVAFRAGHAGVEYFFVLSGFIIFLMHKDDLENSEGASSFAFKRFIRIIPMYWVVLSATILAAHIVPSLNDGTSYSNWEIISNALLFRQSSELIVGVAWTLQNEFAFYLIFIVAIIYRRAGLFIFISWQSACLFFPLVFDRTWPPFISIYNIGFGLGMLSAWVYSKWQIRHPLKIAISGIVLFVAAMIWEWLVGRDIPAPALPLGDNLNVIIFLIPSAVVLFGFVQWERANPITNGKLLSLLGGASYSLYLWHGPIGSVMIRAFGLPVLNSIPHPIVFVLIIVASVLFSILAHLYIEKPTLDFLRRFSPGKRQTRASAGTPGTKETSANDAKS